MRRARWLALLLFASALFASSSVSMRVQSQVDGQVLDSNGPVAGAIVGWQGDGDRVETDAQGRFRLQSSGRTRRIIAHKPGYRIASTPASVRPLMLRLERVPQRDNEDYAWIDPHRNAKEPHNCANCHGEIYREWQGSAHARSATNPKFLALFAEGKTWNARLEHPEGSAVCASCHVPTLRSPTLDYDVREAKGVSKSGIHCDYCHKVADAPTDKLGTRFGRDGLFLLRPAQNDQLFFGPLDDAVRSGESFAYAPFYKESRYCAACHEGTVFGVHAYGTYSEWLESPAKRAGKQCQTCHMAPTGTMTNIAPGKGGIERDPHTLVSHGTPGGSLESLRRSLALKTSMNPSKAGMKVDVEVIARDVGHRVPTGFPDRHLVLVVEAFDSIGERRSLIEGEHLPKSAGKWAGAAGMLYGKQLIGEANRSPIPFWLPVFKTIDTRLHPEKADRRSFVFPAATTRVTVQLWYRRFWQEVADQRGWRDNDVLIVEIDMR